MKTRQWNQALRTYENILKQDPQNLEARFQRGCALALMEQHESAVKAFDEFLRGDDDSIKPFAAFNAGAIYHKLAMRRHDESLMEKEQPYFQKAASWIPNFNLALDMIQFSSMIGRKSTQMTIDAVGIPPDTAMFLKPSSDKENAIYTFDEKSVPMLYFYKSPSALLLLTNQKKTISEMIQQMQLAINVLERGPDTWFNRVLKHTALVSFATTSAQSKDDLGEAIEILNRATGLGLNFSSSYSYLANAYYQQGNATKARQAALKALAINPKSPGMTELIRATEE